jgi:hypothetical protein
MADAVNTHTLFAGPGRLVVQLTSLSDGTGEAAVQKIDISTLATTDGEVPTSLAIKRVNWSISTGMSVSLLFDATTDDVAMRLTGNGERDYRCYGILKDPKSTGATGDLLLTTHGHAASDTYDIIIDCELN